MISATDVDDLAQGAITAEAVAAQARDVTEVSNAQSYAELPQLAALLMAADAVQAAQARNPSISNFAFFICGAEREDLHGNGDARSLDHTMLEELRMHAVRSVQAGERPSGCRSSFECHPTDNEWLAGRYRHGGWGLKPNRLFDRPPKLNARAMQRGLDNDQKNFTRAMLRRWYTPY